MCTWRTIFICRPREVASYYRRMLFKFYSGASSNEGDLTLQCEMNSLIICGKMLYAFTTLKNARKFYWFSTFQALEWISPFDKMKKIVENRVNFAYPILAVNSAVIGQLCFKVCGNRIPLENFWTKSDIQNGGGSFRLDLTWFA